MNTLEMAAASINMINMMKKKNNTSLKKHKYVE